MPDKPALEGKFMCDKAAMSKRIIRRALEFVVATALIVFILSSANTKAGLLYFGASIMILLLSLSILRKWP
jgi:hypothetical protein